MHSPQEIQQALDIVCKYKEQMKYEKNHEKKCSKKETKKGSIKVKYY